MSTAAAEEHRAEARHAHKTNMRRLDKFSRRFDEVVGQVNQRLEVLEGRQEREATRLLLRMDQLRDELDVAQNLSAARHREMVTSGIEQVLGVGERVNQVEQAIRLERRRAYVDIESLIGIHRVLPIRRPLPALGDWAINPDAALYLINHILATKPDSIVEIGSGASTVLAAYAAERSGRGRVYSLEHDERYAEKTSSILDSHNLTSYAEVFHAPLVEVEVNGETFRWYDLSRASLPSDIDVLLVDGPPTKTGALARYPAVPLLWDAIGPGTTVILDDADRPDERMIGQRWLEEYPLTREYLPHERGTASFRRKL